MVHGFFGPGWRPALKSGGYGVSRGGKVEGGGLSGCIDSCMFCWTCSFGVERDSHIEGIAPPPLMWNGSAVPSRHSAGYEEARWECVTRGRRRGLGLGRWSCGASLYKTASGPSVTCVWPHFRTNRRASLVGCSMRVGYMPPQSNGISPSASASGKAHVQADMCRPR
jgi:hypothetical protein